MLYSPLVSNEEQRKVLLLASGHLIHAVPLITSSLLCQPLSAVGWPPDLHGLRLRLSFQAHCHGSGERCLMRCLVRRAALTPPPCSCITFLFTAISQVILLS